MQVDVEDMQEDPPTPFLPVTPSPTRPTSPPFPPPSMQVDVEGYEPVVMAAAKKLMRDYRWGWEVGAVGVGLSWHLGMWVKGLGVTCGPQPVGTEGGDVGVQGGTARGS